MCVLCAFWTLFFALSFPQSHSGNGSFLLIYLSEDHSHFGDWSLSYANSHHTKSRRRAELQRRVSRLFEVPLSLSLARGRHRATSLVLRWWEDLEFYGRSDNRQKRNTVVHGVILFILQYVNLLWEWIFTSLFSGWSARRRKRTVLIRCSRLLDEPLQLILVFVLNW